MGQKQKMEKELLLFRKKIKIIKINIFLHISTRYAKILGETNFEPWEFPQSGKMKERAKVGNNNGQQRIANATSGGACKAAWAKKKEKVLTSPLIKSHCVFNQEIFKLKTEQVLCTTDLFF